MKFNNVNSKNDSRFTQISSNDYLNTNNIRTISNPDSYKSVTNQVKKENFSDRFKGNSFMTITI